MREPKYLLSRIPTAIGIAWVDTNDITKILDIAPQEVLHSSGATAFRSQIHFDDGTIIRSPLSADDFVKQFMSVQNFEKGKERPSGCDHPVGE